jgi:hypothetical protein
VGDEFDGAYECNCDGTHYNGTNCEAPMKLLNCADDSSLVEGRCETFQLEFDTTTRIQKAGVTYTDPVAMSKNEKFYAVNESYIVAPFEVLNTTTPSTGNVSDITYTLRTDAPDNFFLSTTSGEIFWQFEEDDADETYTIILNAVDKGGAKQPIETMVMNVRYKDVDVKEYGPSGRMCANGVDPVDLVEFD